MYNPGVTREAIQDFKGNVVWEEIVFRLAQKQEVLFTKLIDPGNETELKDKLAYAIYTEVRDYPDLFLKEIELEKEEQDDERRAQTGRTGASRRI